MSCGVTGPEKEKEIVLEAERLEIKEKAPMVLAELLFDVNMPQQIRQHRSLFCRVSSAVVFFIQNVQLCFRRVGRN